MGEVIIAKHRNGPTGEAKVRYIANLAKFENWSDDPYGNTVEDGPTTVTYTSKMNTDLDGPDMYQLGLNQLHQNDAPAAEPSSSDNWLDDTDTGANITEDDTPWE
jgi:replicative DNA helicase